VFGNRWQWIHVSLYDMIFCSRSSSYDYHSLFSLAVYLQQGTRNGRTKQVSACCLFLCLTEHHYTGNQATQTHESSNSIIIIIILTLLFTLIILSIAVLGISCCMAPLHVLHSHHNHHHHHHSSRKNTLRSLLPSSRLLSYHRHLCKFTISTHARNHARRCRGNVRSTNIYNNTFVFSSPTVFIERRALSQFHPMVCD